MTPRDKMRVVEGDGLSARLTAARRARNGRVPTRALTLIDKVEGKKKKAGGGKDCQAEDAC